MPDKLSYIIQPPWCRWLDQTDRKRHQRPVHKLSIYWMSLRSKKKITHSFVGHVNKLCTYCATLIRHKPIYSPTLCNLNFTKKKPADTNVTLKLFHLSTNSRCWCWGKMKQYCRRKYLRQCSSFIGEDVFNLTKFLVQRCRPGLRRRVGFVVVHLAVPVDPPTVSEPDHFYAVTVKRSSY